MIHRAACLVLIRRPAPRALRMAGARLMAVAGVVVVIPAVVSVMISASCPNGDEFAQKTFGPRYRENEEYENSGDG